MKARARYYSAAAILIFVLLATLLSGCGWFTNTVTAWCFLGTGDVSDSLTLEFSFVRRPGATDPSGFTADRTLEEISSEIEAQDEQDMLACRIERDFLLVEKSAEGTVFYYVIYACGEGNEFCFSSPVIVIGNAEWFVPVHLLGIDRQQLEYGVSLEEGSYPLLGTREEVIAFYEAVSLYALSADGDDVILTMQSGGESLSVRIVFAEGEDGASVTFGAV